jgi:urease accessory protein
MPYLQLSSPALPIGGFSYSQGLESAVNEGLITNEESSARDWIFAHLNSVIACGEAIYLDLSLPSLATK